MKRRDFLLKSMGITAGALATNSVFGASVNIESELEGDSESQPASASRRPARPRFSDANKNVLLIVSDDHGLQLGCYGDPIATTPNMDALAADGVRFSNAFCTTSSCSPSRSVILTGLHNHANGMFGLQNHSSFQCFESVQSLPSMLRASGYRTGRIGKFHVAPTSVFNFETVISSPKGRNDVDIADRTEEFIASKDPRPFFLYFCTNDPHRTGKALKEKPGQPNSFGNEGANGQTGKQFDAAEMPVPSFLPDLLETKAELAEYYQAFSRVDDGVGRLIQLLKENGKYENTLIIYISDNGMPWPGAKTNLYEPGMRLPCIVRNPRQGKRGQVCNAMISWTDITPTILDYTGTSTPSDHFHGRSFLRAMEQEDPERWDEVYGSHTFHEIQMYYPMRVVHERKFKLIYNIAHPLQFPFSTDLVSSATWQAAIKSPDQMFGKKKIEDYLHRPEFELFDLENDPDEIRNLAEDPAHAETLKRLKSKLRKFQEATKDRWALKWRYE